MKIRKNDNVLVIAGKDKGKRGKVRFAYPKRGALLVEGVNMIKRHTKAKGEARRRGIIEREAPLPCPMSCWSAPTAKSPAGSVFKILEDGRKTRVCRSCNEVID